MLHSRRSRRRTIAGALLVLLGAAVVLAPASAAERDVVVGEVTSRVVRADLDVAAIVRASFDRALRELELKAHGKRVVASVALQDMAIDRPSRSLTCSVSVALRSAPGGAMFATLEGRARVGLASNHETSAEGRAIDAAIRAALAGVPEALR